MKAVDKSGTLVADAVLIECLVDTDNDGIPDIVEKLYPCMSQTVSDAHVDADGDTLNNAFELGIGTEPCVQDTDADTIHDGDEWFGYPSPKAGLGPFITNPLDPDTDGDGCREPLEIGTDPRFGGRRDPTNFWDFFDVHTENGSGAGTELSGAISLGDILAVGNRFGKTGNPNIDPLSDASSLAYHTRYDRGAQVGPNTWNRAGPDGGVALGDVLVIAGQFGHQCP